MFVALPSLALALAGLRAISADGIERAEAQRRRIDFMARVPDDALQAAIGNARTEGTPFQREQSGAVSFARDRVFIADVGAVPARLPAGGDDGITPGEIPAAIIAAITTRSAASLRSALQQLRTGTWWLHIDQRRAYDAELVRRLVSGGVRDVVPNDRRLEWLAQVHAILSASGSGTPGRASGIGTPAGPAMIAWRSRSESIAGNSEGMVFSSAETAALVDAALRHAMAVENLAVRVRDSHGVVIWKHNDDGLSVEEAGRPLSAIEGWTLQIAATDTQQSGRSWWPYGLVALPLALLGFGLVMTSRVVRREVALAQRQAEFTAAVTHEFKSPITSLRLLMERITSGRVGGGEALSEYHAAITRETDRLEGLVNRLLDAQQIQSGKRRYEPVPTEIGSLVAAAADRFLPQAAAKQINLHTDIAPDLRDLMLDRHTVSDALDNLIDNAIKYSPSGTTVNITAEAAGSHLVIAVRDQGAGIHRDDLPHVFEPYYRGRLGDRESVRGTGLGLALVRDAARAHGGSVDVTSSPGQGSTFTLRLPLEQPA